MGSLFFKRKRKGPPKFTPEAGRVWNREYSLDADRYGLMLSMDKEIFDAGNDYWERSRLLIDRKRRMLVLKYSRDSAVPSYDLVGFDELTDVYYGWAAYMHERDHGDEPAIQVRVMLVFTEGRRLCFEQSDYLKMSDRYYRCDDFRDTLRSLGRFHFWETTERPAWKPDWPPFCSTG